MTPSLNASVKVRLELNHDAVHLARGTRSSDLRQCNPRKNGHAGFSGTHIALLQSEYVASLSVFVVAVIVFYANRFVRERSSRIDRASPSSWRERIVILAFLFLGGGIAILLAATRQPVDALTCSGGCRAGGEAIAGDTTAISVNPSQSAVVGAESQALAVGTKLFEERGCAGCHNPDSTGVGPVLQGLFGTPVQDSACGVAIVDESYLREAILNPTATVAMGFPPVMPTFAGQLTEDELETLVVYLKSLSARATVAF